jgi:transcriptional regulator with XRE-family HTH domain
VRPVATRVDVRARFERRRLHAFRMSRMVDAYLPGTRAARPEKAIRETYVAGVRMSDQELRTELRRFLKDRRARVSPGDVGLPTTGRRRVRGLRREEVAGLAGIGVSWYTALESGDADGVSEETVVAVSAALRLSESERNYLLTLTGRHAVPDGIDEPGTLVRETMRALTLPAYVITAAWDILDCNAAFRCVWDIDRSEIPFNAVERLFIDEPARTMHGDRFRANIAPVIAMLRSAVGRRPHVATLRKLRDRLVADEEIGELWDGYEISDPLVSNTCTIASPIGRFTYETLTLANPGETSGIVVQVADRESRERLARAMGYPDLSDSEE